MSNPYTPENSAPNPSEGTPAPEGFSAPAPTAEQAQAAEGFAAPVYQQQNAYAMEAEAQKLRSNSTVILVLGVLGLILIGLFGSIPAWVWGNSTLRRAQEIGLPQEQVSNARIGKILGVVGTVLWCVGIVLVIIAVIVFVGFLASNPDLFYSMFTLAEAF